MVDTDLILAWIEALESGQYKQARGRLRRNDAYCCLGVLADVAIKTGNLDAHWGEHDELVLRYNKRWNSTMPEELYQQVGLATSIGERSDSRSWRMEDGATHPSLADANDAGATLAEVAAALRTQLLPGPKNPAQGELS